MGKVNDGERTGRKLTQVFGRNSTVNWSMVNSVLTQQAMRGDL
jgi:hypothetical protein